jgi:hypothetical protein
MLPNVSSRLEDTQMDKLTEYQKAKAKIVAMLVTHHLERGSVSTSRHEVSKVTKDLIEGANRVAEEILKSV